MKVDPSPLLKEKEPFEKFGSMKRESLNINKPSGIREFGTERFEGQMKINNEKKEESETVMTEPKKEEAVINEMEK